MIFGDKEYICTALVLYQAMFENDFDLIKD